MFCLNHAIMNPRWNRNRGVKHHIMHIETTVSFDLMFTLLMYVHLQKNAFRPQGSYEDRVKKALDMDAQPDEKTRRNLC